MDDSELADVGLRYDFADGVVTLTLDKPGRMNSMTPRLWFALAEIGDQVPDDTRVVVVRGAGECFSAGLDRGMLSPDGPDGEPGFADLVAKDDDGMRAEIARYQEGFVWLRRPEFVSIAQVHGYAIGGGLQLALACDIRVLADDAQLCMKEPALGIVPDLAGTKPLVDAVGYSRALEICATARYVGAVEATAIGLAELTVPRAELDSSVADLAAAIAANPASAVGATKQLLLDASGRSLDDQRAAEAAAQVPLLRGLASALG